MARILKLSNWIGGRFLEPSSLKYLENINPYTQEIINLVPSSSLNDVNNAVEVAKNSLERWSNESIQNRANYLLNIANEIEKYTEEFALAESRDTGKPLNLSRNLDIARSVDNFRFFAKLLIEQQHTSYKQTAPQRATHHILHRPIGVAGLISPWNLPLYLLTWKVAPALAAGCTIVAKPSEITPTTATLLAEATKRAGLPDGVFNIVHGLGGEVGSAIVGHKDVAAISFTGGTATGRIVATEAAPHFKKVSLELGGKNPAIVLADADIDFTVKGIVRSGFLNSGQICLCGSRILVHRSIHDEFLSKLTTELNNLKMGDPTDPSTDIGPVVSELHLNKVRAAVERAVFQGAQIVSGGLNANVPSNGYFFPPTIITGVEQNCEIVQEEVFGPVVTVQIFDTLDEALQLANGVRYGLAASIWTRSLQSIDTSPRELASTSDAMYLANKLDCGLVWVNCWLLRDLRIPFGGTKQSGVGREGGAHSLEFFSETTSVCLAETSPIPPLPSKMKPVSIPSSVTGVVTQPPLQSQSESQSQSTFHLKQAPTPVGAYAHAKLAGGLLFLAGVGPRTPVTNIIPGGPIRDPVTKAPNNYDIEAQTRSCIENVKTILEGCGSSLDKVIDVQCFLIDMDRDFQTFNKVYAEYFKDVNATRTTIAIRALPTPIAVELKVIALP
mmetsp:Transcript_10908/g.11325  ORF Transcript_10908/g.11325 Transcript_10908/m.11325 type:complete len:671 (+) Transcript_10908:20-2032(+)